MAKADFPKAKAEFGSTAMGVDEWVGVFDDHVDVMWSILADIYNIVKDEEERDAGVRRMGRRPFRAAGSIEELLSTVFPVRYTLEPFSMALNKLIGKRSQRAFAMKIPVNQSTLSRLLAGTIQPDMPMLESVARAAKVHPTFFVEYRGLIIAEIVRRVLTEQPHLGIQAIKRMRAELHHAAA